MTSDSCFLDVVLMTVPVRCLRKSFFLAILIPLYDGRADYLRSTRNKCSVT